MSSKGGGKKPKPTEHERALAETGAEQWNHFVTRLSPAIHRGVELSRATSADRRDIGAQASGAVAAELSEFRPRSGSGRDIMAAHAASGMQAAAPAAAAAEAEPQLHQREQRGLLGAVALGRGIHDQGTRGMVDLGNRATDAGIQKLQNRTDLRRGLISGAATLAGAYGQSKGWFDPRTQAAGSGGP